MVYERMDAQLNFVSASLRQEAIAATSRIAADTFNELWSTRVRPLVTQLWALRDLVPNVEARLTGPEIPLKRQPERPTAPPKDFRADARCLSPESPFPTSDLSKYAGAAPSTSNVVGTGAPSEALTRQLHPQHTFHRTFPPRLSPFTLDSRFCRSMTHIPVPLTSSAFPVQPQCPPFPDLFQIL